ncbi:MAG: hypothetical protein KDD44_12685, partial [Bdellovibrionales bacterium]|nr:hypothetical protein [Bdellovibrionales bacterium]
FGSYNLFLTMENWLKILNYAPRPARVVVTVNSATGSTEEEIVLPPLGSALLPIHDSTRFHTSPDTYGTVELRVKDGTTISAELLRRKPSSAPATETDFAAPTAVR